MWWYKKELRKLGGKKILLHVLFIMLTACVALLFQNNAATAYDVSRTDISVVDGAGAFVLSNDKTMEVTPGGVSVTGDHTQSSNLTALEMQSGSQADIAGDVTINTGKESAVIHATNAEVNVGGSVKVISDISDVVRNTGIHAVDSSVNISKDVLVESRNSDNIGLLLDGSTALIDGNVRLTYATPVVPTIRSNFGVKAINGSDVTIGGNVELSGGIRQSTGVYAEDGDVVIKGDIILSRDTSNSNIGVEISGGSVTAENIKLTDAGSNTGLVVSNNGTATINGGVIISSDLSNGGTGVKMDSGNATIGYIDINAYHAIGVEATGGTVRVEGDIKVHTLSLQSDANGLYLHPSSGVPVAASVGGDILVDGNSANGISGVAGTVNSIAPEIFVEGNVRVSDGGDSNGIISVGNINISKDVSVTDSQISQGIYTYQSSNTVIDGNLSVVGGLVNTGYLVDRGGSAPGDTTLTVGGDVIVDGGRDNRGINTNIADRIFFANIEGDLKIIGGSNNTGAFITSSGDLRVGNNVEVVGSGNYGIISYGAVAVDGDVTVTAGGAITASSSGITLHKDGTGVIKGNLNVSGNAVGAKVSGSNSELKVAGLITVGLGATGVLVNNSGHAEVGNVSVTDRYAYGLQAGKADANTGARITVTGDLDASGAGVNSVGAMALLDGHISLIGGNIAVSDTSLAGLYAYKGGKFTLEDMTASAAGASLIYTDSSGDVTITNSNLSGNILHDGSVYAGSLNVSLTDSSLTGLAQAMAGGRADMTLTDSTWRLTGDSNLGGGTLTNNGIVDYRGTSAFSTLTVGDLSGSGTFVMKTDIAGRSADKLIVNGDTNGSFLLDIQNNGGYNTTGNEVLTMVETANRNGDFALAHSVEVGGWLYGLRQNTDDFGIGAGWELYSTGQVTIPADGAINTFSGSYLLNYAETTFMQRMGDLRSSPKLVGLWARGYGGQFEKKSAGQKAFDMDFWGISIGYDRKVNINWNGDLYVGAFFGYSQGDIDYENGGSGNVDSQTIGVYASFVSPGGFYADSVLKYRWRSSDFDTYDSAGAHVTSDTIHTAGFGWSLELGQRISFGGQPRRGWYMEPQVQIRYQRHDDGYYNLSNGLRIGTEGATSTIGRVGSLIGYETENRNFYVKVFRAKEFDWELNVYANGDLIDHSSGGSWWIYGLGYTTRMNDRNSLYLDLERTSGSDFEQKWRLNLGWRMEI